MNCKTLHLHLDAYLDDRLQPEEVEPLEYHLSRCALCRETLAAEADLFALLNETGADGLSPLPADFTAQVTRQLANEPTPVWPWLQQPWTIHQYGSVIQAFTVTATMAAAFQLLVQWEGETGSLYSVSVRAQELWYGAVSLLY